MKKRNTNLKLRVAIIASEEFATIEEFADFIDMPLTTFSRKLNGHNEFSESEIQRISEALDISPMEIFFNSQVTKRITKSA